MKNKKSKFENLTDKVFSPINMKNIKGASNEACSRHAYRTQQNWTVIESTGDKYHTTTETSSQLIRDTTVEDDYGSFLGTYAYLPDVDAL